MKHSDFTPNTILSEAQFQALEQAGAIQLTANQRAAVQGALQEYEFFRKARASGEGSKLKTALVSLQSKFEGVLAQIEVVRSEPGHIWEYLAAESEVDCDKEISRLTSLLTQASILNQRIGRAGRKRDYFLESLLSSLAETSTAISRGSKPERGGRFLEFAYTAVRTLPRPFNAVSKDGLGGRWERIRRQKRSGGRAYMWVGGPHPAAAKPWFETSTRRFTDN